MNMTIDEIVSMLKELQDELRFCELNGLYKPNYKEGFNDGISFGVKKIQDRIDNLQTDPTKSIF